MAERTYYPTHPYLQRRFDKLERPLSFSRVHSLQEWEVWRAETSRKLRELIGYDTMQPCDPDPVSDAPDDLGDHWRQRVVIQTEPGVYMPFYVLKPRVSRPPYAAVIAVPGHTMGGKDGVAGIRTDPAVAAAIDRYNGDYGLQLVRQGFLVFCPDPRGYGERQEEWERPDPLMSSCDTLTHMALGLGQTVLGMETWDLHRLIDYIVTRDDCDPERIGMVGLSGGGMQTLWAAALDDRVRAAAISGYLYGFKEAHLDMPRNCSCNYVPHLWEYLDMGDIAALIAPRALIVETGSRDRLNGASGLANVLTQMATVRKAYALLGYPERVRHDVFEGEHRWNGREVGPWLRQHLAP